MTKKTVTQRSCIHSRIYYNPTQCVDCCAYVCAGCLTEHVNPISVCVACERIHPDLMDAEYKVIARPWRSNG